MNGTKLRKNFLEYFREKGLRIAPSSPLIPKGDPTLLFTAAGMVQFKANFLGADKTLKNAATCQKCMRTTDIDNVGFTNRHLTFFEMLGNFSFGDYFKEEAIAYAWEYLTKVVNLDPARLHVSIYKGGIAQRDEEAYNIWLKYVPKERIVELGEADNFWTMGPTGPCGPCSEIYYDFGGNGCKQCRGIECDCGRYVEIWNLVFTQFDRREDGSLAPLPQKNIDTGMGLERLAMAAEGVQSPFETSLFMPVIDRAKELFKIKGETAGEVSTLRIAADHVRGASFLIAEGVLPSNEGRGYILRRLIRRVVRYARVYGVKDVFMSALAEEVYKLFSPVYPEIKKHFSLIKDTLDTEEKAFLRTLEAGEKELRNLLAHSGKMLNGKDVFNLYETFGFPYELTREIALLNETEVDEEGFLRAKKEAQELSRSYAGEDAKERAAALQKLDAEFETEFVGYERLSARTKILALLNDKYERVQTLSGPGAVVLEETPFYPLGGGQVGDGGVIKTASGAAFVSGAERPLSRVIVHDVKVDGVLNEGEEAAAAVNQDRQKTAANHTAIHLVNEALKKILGPSVRQAGSFVSPDMFRFDYTTPRAPSPEELGKVFAIANDAVLQNLDVHCALRPLADAEKLGAVTLAGEQYADPARFVMVGGGFDAPQSRYSLELCGGTHVSKTSEIISIILIKESSLSAGVRRIEGVAGLAAIEHLKIESERLRGAARLLSVPSERVPSRVEELLKEHKEAKKEVAQLKSQSLKAGAEKSAQTQPLPGGGEFVFLDAQDAEPKALRSLADNLSHKYPKAVISAAVKREGKISFVIKTTGGYDAAGIAQAAAKTFGGKAGGRGDFAQGGCEDAPWEEFKKVLLASVK